MKLLPTILREILAVVDLVIIPVLWTRSRNWGLVDFRISVKVTAPWQVERTDCNATWAPVGSYQSYPRPSSRHIAVGLFNIYVKFRGCPAYSSGA